MNDASPTSILIVDDETLARERLIRLLRTCPAVSPDAHIHAAASGEQALAVAAAEHIDLALLDIQMPGMDGLALGRYLASLKNAPAIVYVTAYGEYALAAFEVGAVDYLLKPIRPERLKLALERAHPPMETEQQALTPLGARRQHLLVYERNECRLLPLDDIQFLKAELKYVTVQTQAKEFLLNDSLVRLEQEFPDAFLRIHRNCLVNRKHLTGIELRHTGDENTWVALLRDSDLELPIARRQVQPIKAYLAEQAGG